LRGSVLLKRIVATLLALLNVMPSAAIIFNPLFFIMFLPLGIYAVLFWPWSILKYIPDPFHRDESLYWLTYAIKTDNNFLFPSLFRWGVVDSILLVSGSIIFIIAFVMWLISLKRNEGLLTHGIYKIVRHPQYLGIILLALGLSIRSLRPISLIAWITLLFGYLILASLEEKSLLEIYRSEYEKYSEKTPFLIPFLKLNIPEWLSVEKPYRYLLFIVFYLIAVMTIIATMRNMVFALRNVF